MAQATTPEPYPLYNTTFTLHRVSPFYTGLSFPLSNSSLTAYARSFRDILAGEVLRGVRVGLAQEDDALARSGALQAVTWKLLVEEDLWNTEVEDETMDLEARAGRGILVQVAYERAEYRAILLRGEGHRGQVGDESMVDIGEKEGGVAEGFEKFPLLLTRMTASLRETFTDFLSTTFDARVSVLHLSGSYLNTSLEKYISDCSMDGDGQIMDMADRSPTLRRIVKDVQVLIGFDTPTVSPALQSIEFLVDKEDIPRLVQKGKMIGKREDEESPFMGALGRFVQEHMALDMKHERVKILRIASGAFVLGAEGKIKLTEPSVGDDGGSLQRGATWKLINELVEIAKGRRLLMGKEAS